MECVATTSKYFNDLPSLDTVCQFNSNSLEPHVLDQTNHNYFFLQKATKNVLPSVKTSSKLQEMDIKHLRIAKSESFHSHPDSKKTSLDLSKNSSPNKVIMNNNCDNEISNANFLSTKCMPIKKLIDQCWYHGMIKRMETQRLLRNEGDFLVRESISGGPGHYVLSGLFNGNHIHFEINEYNSDEGDYSVPLYHFEDEKFRSIVDLIEFYVVHKKKITATCEFVLKNPIMKKPELFNIFGHNSQPDIEVEYASYVEKFKKDSEFYLKTHQNATLSNKVLISQALKSQDNYNSYLSSDCNRSNQSNEALNTKLNIMNFTNKTLLNENAPKKYTPFHRVERKVPSFKYRPPSPPKSPPPPTPIQTQQVAKTLTNGILERKKVDESELNDYCDIDYEALNAELEEHRRSLTQKKASPLLSEQLNSKSLANLTWQSNRCSEILDASITSLNKVASSNNFCPINERYSKTLTPSSINSKSSGNLLITDGFSDITGQPNFYTLHLKRSLPAENENKTSISTRQSNNVSYFYDRAHSCQNLLACKSTMLLNEGRLYNDAAPRNYLTMKAGNMRDTHSALHRVAPAPSLPLRRRSTTIVRGSKCLQNVDAILSPHNNNNNNADDEADYDKPSSSRHSNSEDSEFSDYNKISAFPVKISKTTKRLNISNFETFKTELQKIEKRTLKQTEDNVTELKKGIPIDKILAESTDSKINFQNHSNNIKSKEIVMQTMEYKENESIDKFCLTLSTADVRKLAMWITKEDCRIFRLGNAETEKLNGTSFANSLMDENSELRRTLIKRVELLSFAITKSIENSAFSTDHASCQLIERWSDIAKILLEDLDNAFSFGTIIGVLKNYMISHPEIWSKLDKFCAEKLKSQQINVYDQFNVCDKSLPLYSLPYIQPQLQMISKLFLEEVQNFSCPLLNFYGKQQEMKFEFLWNFLKLSQQILLLDCNYDNKPSNEKDKKHRDENIFNNESLQQLI